MFKDEEILGLFKAGVKEGAEVQDDDGDPEVLDPDKVPGQGGSEGAPPAEVNPLDDAQEVLPDVVSSLYAAIAESAGLEDADGPKTPEELIAKLSGLIVNNTPKYSSPLSEEFDLFLKEGGSPEDFFEAKSTSGSLGIRLNTEEEKISVIEQVLADAGFSKDKIAKKIEKYLENDTLDDEAEDALLVLKEKSATKAKLKAESELKLKEERDREAAAFLKDVEKNINTLPNIRGVELTPIQRKELIDYCLKVDKKDGLTGFQRDYAKSPVSNFIESAFFAKYGNHVLKAAAGAGSSNALEKFKATLKQTRMSGSGQRSTAEQNKAIDQFIRAASVLSGRK